LRRWAASIAAWLVATAILVPVCFFAVILFAGPHSDLLPSVLQPPVLILGWLTVLAGPVLVARAVWRRVGAAPGSET
jgi:hypothetical protein